MPAPRAEVVRQVVTIPLSDVDFVLQTEGEVVDVDVRWEPHTHEVDELLWSTAGIMSVTVGDRLWTLPAGSGVWIPANVVHHARVGANSGYGAAFFRPGSVPGGTDAPFGIALTPILRELLWLLVDPSLPPDTRHHAERLALELLVPDRRSHGLLVPQDRRIAPLAQAIVDDPSDGRSQSTWARQAGVSARTVNRAFVEATGLTFGQWRRAARMHAAAARLSEGESVAEVAEAVGYGTSSAFIAAFRQTTGRTPTQLLRSTRRSTDGH